MLLQFFTQNEVKTGATTMILVSKTGLSHGMESNVLEPAAE